ncbi:MAG: DUF4350 domain-containing protein [Infirmifilum sp.]
MIKELTVATSTALLTIALLTWFYPVSADFQPNNDGWNGLAQLVSKQGSIQGPLELLATLNPKKYTLFIIGPSLPFKPQEVNSVRGFLAKGGRVVLADDFGSANQLLEELRVPLRIEGGIVRDPLLNIGAPELPVAYWSRKRIALNYASALNTSLCSDCQVLAYSSIFSYLDKNLNGQYDAGEPVGPLPIVVSIKLLGGELVVISDSSVFINSMLTKESNAELLAFLLGQTVPAIDNTHWEPDTLSSIKAALYSLYTVVSSYELRYVFAASIPLLLIIYKRRETFKKRLKTMSNDTLQA